jgi:hypothetical protein
MVALQAASRPGFESGILAASQKDGRAHGYKLAYHKGSSQNKVVAQ